MKAYRLIGLLLTLAAVAVAAQVIIEVPTAPARMSVGVVGGGGPVAASCSASTEYVGNNVSQADTRDHSENYLYCIRSQASCSGALNTAFAQHHGTGTDNLLVWIFTSTDAAPAAADTYLGTSGTITSSTNGEWASSAMVGTINVTSGSYYMVCSITDATAWATRYATTGGTGYYLSGWTYGTPPANLSTGFASTTRIYPWYISIGN